MEQNEQQELAGLEERYQWTRRELESRMPTNRPATLQEIQQAMDYTQQLVQWFQTYYGLKASSLQAAGFSRLANRLRAIIADLQQAHTTYASMYQQAIQPKPSPGAFPSPDPDIIGAMNRKNEMIRASFLNQCWNCKLQFGAEEFLRLVYCPNCNAMLHH